MLDPRFVLLGVALSAIGTATYTVATVRGRVQPNRVSWFLWGAAPLIGFFAQISHGFTWASLCTLSIGVGPLVVFAASFTNRRSYWRIGLFDVSCGAVAVVALILWLSLDDPLLAVLASVAADLIGGIPTIIKAWRYPWTERAVPFVLTGCNGVITLLTLRPFTVIDAAFPLYLVTLGAGLAAIIAGRRRFGSPRPITESARAPGGIRAGSR